MKSISKTAFLEGIRCLKLFWLRYHHSELATPPDPVTRWLFETGHRIEIYAHKLFPGGIHIGNVEGTNFPELIKKTKNAMKGMFPVFEGTFSSNGTHCRADILEKHKGGWDLNEIKMCTTVKPEHPLDIGFQKICIERAGYKIDKSNLIFINNKYIRKGEIEPDELFCMEDISSEVEIACNHIPFQLNNFQRTVEASEAPAVVIGSQCKSPGKCPFYSYCHKDLPEGSVHQLPYGSKIVPFLLSKGILKLEDIPKGFPLTYRQAALVESARKNEPIICKTEIAAHLSSLRYPLRFLDFETMAPAVPPWDQSSAYEKQPFQYSLHIQHTDNGNLEHKEFIAVDATDPREELLKNLIDDLGTTGSIISYNMSFEIGVLKGLQKRFPQYSKAIANLLPRFWDLIVPFRSGHYSDFRFRGSASLKAVTPVMVPALSYDNLNIQKGDEASMLFDQFVQGVITKDDWAIHSKNLKEYCKRDTIVMIKILEILKKVVST